MTDHGDTAGTPEGGTHGAEEDLLGPELRTMLRSLPRGIPPERDLTAEIAAQTWDSRERLPGASSVGAKATERRRRFLPLWGGQGLTLAAAAVALVVVTSAVTMVLVREQAEVSSDNAADGPAVSQASFAGYQVVEDQYASAIADLLAALEAERDRLPPETVRLIEENLRIIDDAIRQSLAALESSPQSLPLQQVVMTSYERKLDFLRQATAITAEG